MGGLGRDAYYEQQRNAGKLISFDVVAEVEEVKKRDGVVFVFLSHQCGLSVRKSTSSGSVERPRHRTVTEQAPLFGDLIDAVKWYADREEGAAGEPPDFAPGTNARRRTALKKPPARPSRLLSALSFRSTPATTAPSVGSAASSRKSYRG